MKRLSIIIVTYNSEQDIFDCLHSIFSYCDIPEEQLEVIVVDNASKYTDAMFRKIQSEYEDKVVLVRNTQNGGYGQGNNVGIRRASAPVILIMNPDVRLRMPVFAKALSAFEQRLHLSIYGMKQMRSEQVKSRISFCCLNCVNGYVYTLMTALCNRLDWYIQRFMYIQGSCFFIRKSMLEQIGLFDESIFMYGEEDDIHFRLTRQFYHKIIYDKHLSYIHKTIDRELKLDYLMRMLNVALEQNEKRGISKRKTVINKIRNNRLLILRELIHVKLRKKESRTLPVLKAFHRNLKQMLNTYCL